MGIGIFRPTIKLGLLAKSEEWKRYDFVRHSSLCKLEYFFVLMGLPFFALENRLDQDMFQLVQIGVYCKNQPRIELVIA